MKSDKMSLEDLKKEERQNFIDKVINAMKSTENTIKNKGFFKFESGFYISDLKPELDLVKISHSRDDRDYTYICEYSGKYYIIEEETSWGEFSLTVMHNIAVYEISKEDAMKKIK